MNWQNTQTWLKFVPTLRLCATVCEAQKNMRNRDAILTGPRTYELPEDPNTAKPQKVLVVEGNRVFATRLKVALEDQDYRVTVVRSGTEGVQHILATEFDAVLCDLEATELPGDMFSLAAVRARPQLEERLVFLAGQPGEVRLDDFIAKAPNRVLRKPFAMRELFDALEAVTGRSH